MTKGKELHAHEHVMKTEGAGEARHIPFQTTEPVHKISLGQDTLRGSNKHILSILGLLQESSLVKTRTKPVVAANYVKASQ